MFSRAIPSTSQRRSEWLIDNARACGTVVRYRFKAAHIAYRVECGPVAAPRYVARTSFRQDAAPNLSTFCTARTLTQDFRTVPTGPFSAVRPATVRVHGHVRWDRRLRIPRCD